MYRAERVGGVWRLVTRPEGTRPEGTRPEGTPDDEEVVVSFQGILIKMDMPPFNEKNM
jgi:hypothetical protein